MAAIAEVGANAGTEFFRFADIEDAIGSIPHEVNSRFGGDFLEPLLDVGRGRRSDINDGGIELVAF